MKYRRIDSPFGELVLAGDEEGLKWVAFSEGTRALEPRREWTEANRDALLGETRRQLRAYFAGRLRDFDVPLAPEGTPFQQRVWKELLAIPFGKTRTYRELARRIRRPRAFRAVGAANGANPVSILIPCHRLVGSDGSLTGYGGGLSTKEALLRLEGAR